MFEYKIIRDVSPDNFLFGGLVYHHKEILDPDTRDREFEKLKRDIEIKKGLILDKGSKNVYETDTYEVDNIYSVIAEIKNIQKSQSLTEYALQRTLDYYNSEPEQYPVDEIYDCKEHQNTFVNSGIKIIPSDVIIFLSQKGVIGNLFKKEHNNQKFLIRYMYDQNFGLNFGEVFDQKIIDDFLNYEDVAGDLNG